MLGIQMLGIQMSGILGFDSPALKLCYFILLTSFFQMKNSARRYILGSYSVDRIRGGLVIPIK